MEEKVAADDAGMQGAGKGSAEEGTNVLLDDAGDALLTAAVFAGEPSSAAAALAVIAAVCAAAAAADADAAAAAAALCERTRHADAVRGAGTRSAKAGAAGSVPCAACGPCGGAIAKGDAVSGCDSACDAEGVRA